MLVEVVVMYAGGEMWMVRTGQASSFPLYGPMELQSPGFLKPREGQSGLCCLAEVQISSTSAFRKSEEAKMNLNLHFNCK